MRSNVPRGTLWMSIIVKHVKFNYSIFVLHILTGCKGNNYRLSFKYLWNDKKVSTERQNGKKSVYNIFHIEMIGETRQQFNLICFVKFVLIFVSNIVKKILIIFRN